jgi:DNA-binding MarR family transcriptional regulator
MNSIPSLGSCNLFSLRQATRFVSQLYERHLAPVALTSSQFTILATLEQWPGVTMSQMVPVLVMDRTSLVRALQPLVRDGLVADRPSSESARKKALSLTPLGLQRYQDALPLWNAAQQEFEQRVGPERALALRTVLTSITKKEQKES